MEKVPEIKKRPATKEDEDTARNIHHSAYHDVIVRQYGSWDDSMQDDFFNNEWSPEKYKIILSGESISGYCSIEHNADHIFVHELVLSPDFQGKGIGSKVLEELIEESKRENIPIKLRVLKENQAQYLYRRLGFKDTGSTNSHFQMEFNPDPSALE